MRAGLGPDALDQTSASAKRLTFGQKPVMNIRGVRPSSWIILEGYSENVVLIIIGRGPPFSSTFAKSRTYRFG